MEERLCCAYLSASGSLKWRHSNVFTAPKIPSFSRQIAVRWKQNGCVCAKNGNIVDDASLVHRKTTLSRMMLRCAKRGLFKQANGIWEEMLSSSYVPSVQTISGLIDAYAKMGLFHEVNKVLDQLSSCNFHSLPAVYSLAISCFGEEGQLELMENTLEKMVAKGIPVGYVAGNAFVRYCSIHGSLTDMETAYYRLKRSKHLIGREEIRAVSSAYIREGKFYRLGEFLRDVGLGRKNVGNLLWNLLLLSYAANFKMKTLQREFLKMLEAGFRPDLTTFNIRALAFSRMLLLWDLHLTVEHMNHQEVVPDLVTYGCVVDAYLNRGFGRNLDFILNKMNLDHCPVLSTDPLVFEALGKGDFHLNSEAFLEFRRQRKWTYRELIALHLKKQYRINQIFWNY